MLGFKWSVSRSVVFTMWLIQYYTFGSAILWFALSTFLIGAVVLGFLTYDYDYWIARGVFSPPALPLVGHIKTVVTFQEQGGMCFKRIYDTYKDLRFLGKLISIYFNLYLPENPSFGLKTREKCK